MHTTISVTVRPEYLAHQSKPRLKKYAFAYHITISNRGHSAARLVGRVWKITDLNNKVKEITGSGVVGEQPNIAPGSSYRYTSGVVLDTPVGTMEGHYKMTCEDGQTFNAAIPLFVLATPGSLH